MPHEQYETIEYEEMRSDRRRTCARKKEKKENSAHPTQFYQTKYNSIFFFLFFRYVETVSVPLSSIRQPASQPVEMH